MHWVLRLPEIVAEVSSHLIADGARKDLLAFALTSSANAEVALVALWRAPVFTPQNTQHIKYLLSLASFTPSMLSRPYFDLIRQLDVRRLAVPSPESPDPATEWVKATNVALRLTASCKNLISLLMDGWPPDVAGRLFNRLLEAIPLSIEHINWSRVAVSDQHLLNMANRWPRLRTFRIGIVTPMMWGAYQPVANPTQHTEQVGSNFGGLGISALSRNQGLARLLRTSPRLEVIGVEPMPGDDGTEWLLKVLSENAPKSLKRVELGRGRYLLATARSAKRVWRALAGLLMQTLVNRCVIIDPFFTIRHAAPSLFVLTENYILVQRQRQLMQLPPPSPAGSVSFVLPATDVPPEHVTRLSSVIIFAERGIRAIRTVADQLGVEHATAVFCGDD